jgi:hypothetical protein
MGTGILRVLILSSESHLTLWSGVEATGGFPLLTGGQLPEKEGRGLRLSIVNLRDMDL